MSRSYRNDEQNPRKELRREATISRITQNEDAQAVAEARYKGDRLRAIAGGAPESSLPPATHGMDLVSANQRLSSATGGRGAAPMDAPVFKDNGLDRATQAGASVAGSRAPLDVNTPGTLQRAAKAASPAPFQSTGAPLKLPPQGSTPHSADADLARNLAMTQPGGLDQFRQPATGPLARAAAAPAAPPQSNGIGKVVPQAQSDALLGKVEGPNGYGTGSVRFAKAGEERAGPSQMTENGVIGQAPAVQKSLAEMRNELYKTHPEIWTPGSPENQAFLAHHAKFGAQSAYENAPALMATLKPGGTASGATGQTAKNDLPNSDQAERDARIAATSAAAQPPLPPGALVDPRSVLGQVVHPADTAKRLVGDAGDAIKSAGRKALEYAGVTPEGVSTIKGGLDKFAHSLLPRPALTNPTATPPAQVAPAAPVRPLDKVAGVPNPQPPVTQAATSSGAEDEAARRKRLAGQGTLGSL